VEVFVGGVVVGGVFVGGVVAAPGPQEARTSAVTIRQLTSNHIIFFFTYPPPFFSPSLYFWAKLP